MGDRYVATVRFHTEGVEAELYQRLIDGKKEAGLSVPDYIKQILTEYFANKDWKDNQKEILEQFREDLFADMEQVIRECISKYAVVSGNTDTQAVSAEEHQDDKGLPAQGEEIPEGALDFLDGMC